MLFFNELGVHSKNNLSSYATLHIKYFQLFEHLFALQNQPLHLKKHLFSNTVTPQSFAPPNQQQQHYISNLSLERTKLEL